MRNITIPKMTNADVIAYIDKAKDNKDLAFIEYINQITWGYKVELKRERTNYNHNHTKNENNK